MSYQATPAELQRIRDEAKFRKLMKILRSVSRHRKIVIRDAMKHCNTEQCLEIAKRSKRNPEAEKAR